MLSAVSGTLLLASCSAGRSYLTVAQGNYAYDRGSYQQATVDYLEAQKSGSFPDWVAYDLGNVYHALGEPDGASAEWTKAEKAADPRVVLATLFNEGVLDFELGRYRDAYDRFKKVLEITPEDIDAKVNLELAFAKMTTKEVPPRVGNQNEPIAVKNQTNKANQILEIVRQKENGIFTPPPPPETKSTVPDW
jgi:Ca-activated chloride channel family protein